MATDHLTLPNFIEPPPRIPVTARHVGPVLAAARRHSGYQFRAGAASQGDGCSWLDRVLRRRR